MVPKGYESVRPGLHPMFWVVIVALLVGGVIFVTWPSFGEQVVDSLPDVVRDLKR